VILVRASFRRGEVIPPVVLVDVGSLGNLYPRGRCSKEDWFRQTTTGGDLNLASVDPGVQTELDAVTGDGIVWVDVLAQGEVGAIVIVEEDL
jgi:hypothetical protein